MKWRQSLNSEAEMMRASFKELTVKIHETIDRKVERFMDEASTAYSEVEPIAKECEKALKDIKEEAQLLQLFRDPCTKEEEFLEHHPRHVQRVNQAAQRGAAVLNAQAWPKQPVKIEVKTEQVQGCMPQMDVEVKRY